MDPQRVLSISEPAIGLEAVIVLDSTALGPAAGGVRTARYANLAEATAEAAALARSMTLKCSLAGLEAGGGKAVIMQKEDWDRAAVFRRFGEIVQELGGSFRTAGDLGTDATDLRHMASTCEFVHTKEAALSDAVALGLSCCIEALARAKGRDMQSLKIAVQGCGAIGSAVARTLSKKVAETWVTDIRAEAASRLAKECGGVQIDPDKFVAANVDVLSPCAKGGVLREDNVDLINAWGVCAGANLAIANAATQSKLFERGLLVVPDLLASAGAVIDGIGDSLMGLTQAERRLLIEGLGKTARKVLVNSDKENITTQIAAERMAMERLS